VTVVAVVGGAVATVALAPVALGAAGFTSAGIAAGSVAAKMMSVTAVASGGGVAAGSAVAVLQSAASESQKNINVGVVVITCSSSAQRPSGIRPSLVGLENVAFPATIFKRRPELVISNRTKYGDIKIHNKQHVSY
uniref:Uncharacterized protein n=1 Tax=Takifugu rubripes TaxID=31033 RepID=A0A674MNV7_TAKRU